jgi:hypothetical protein
MEEYDDGPWVAYSDYEELQAKYEALSPEECDSDDNSDECNVDGDSYTRVCSVEEGCCDGCAGAEVAEVAFLCGKLAYCGKDIWVRKPE